MAELAGASLFQRIESSFQNGLIVRPAIVITTILLAWPAIFSTLALYDDEGYVMMTLQTYMQGHRLYGETHTQYGPAFYYLTAPLHTLLNVPLTQTGVRIKTIVCWVIAVLLVYEIVKRMSRSSAAGIVTAILAALHLDKLALEPGHPQELTLLCTLLVLSLFTRSMYAVNDAKPTMLSMSSWLAVGFLTGILGLIKLNCGVVVAIPIVVTAALQTNWGRRFHLGSMLVVIGPALAIAWVARTHPSSSLWAIWLAICAASLVHFASARRDDRSHQSIAFLLSVVAGGALAVAMILGLAIRQGVSIGELWFGMIGQHADFADYFFAPIGFSASALLGVLLAIGAWLSPRAVTMKEVAKPLIWMWVALSVAFTAAMPLEHGMHARGPGLFLAWAAPLWIVWFWRNDVAQSPKKLLLGLVAILSPLIAFPVAGTQVQIGTLPALIVIGILLGEYLFAIAKQVSGRESTNVSFPYRSVCNWVFTGALCTMFSATAVHWVRYANGQPLGLPGSEWMRLSESIASEQRAISDAIVKSGASHLLFEGTNHNRFYFWTSTKPLTSANPTFWPVMLVDGERHLLADAIDRQSRLCVVRVPNYDWLYFDQASEIRERIEARWQPSESIGDWQIGIAE